MKILHYINNLGSGGAEKLLTDILPQMADHGHEITLLTANPAANVPRYEQLLLSQNVSVSSLNTSFYNPLQIFALYRFIKRGRFDIVHAHLFPTQYWLAFLSLFLPKTIKLVKTEHSVFNERKNYAILKPLEKFVYNRYHAIIGITALVTQNLRKWLGPSLKSQLITSNNGVNLEQIRQAQQKPADDSSLFMEPGLKILMVGRFDGSQKDQPSLIKAFAMLPQNTQLYFAGEGPATEAARKLAQSLHVEQRVHFLGMRTDVYQLMAAVDLNILSTNHEGLSGVVLESLASGKPFLGTDVVGVNDVVPNADFLFEKANPESLAKKIKWVLNDAATAENLVRLAREHVQQYDIKNMVKHYLNLYETLYNER